MFKVNNKNTNTLCVSSAFIVKFKQVNVSWDESNDKLCINQVVTQ